jgi:hypothetical protein
MMDGTCNTPLSKVRLPSNPHVGWTHVFMHSTPLSNSLCVKWLTQSCHELGRHSSKVSHLVVGNT